MAKEMKAHNILNFPALLEVPGTVTEKAVAEKTRKDSKGKTVVDAEGNPVKDSWEYSYPVFSVDSFDAIVETFGKANLIAVLNDEAKIVYRSAPTEEKLRNDAINAMVRAGVPREQAEAMFQ